MSFVWTKQELNAEQTAAVHEEESVFVIACPGSGKTRTLTYKIAYELSRVRRRNQYIIALTYTHRAADEIRERIEELGVDASQLWIGTIHSFCLEWILKPYGIYEPELAHGFSIVDGHEQQVLLENICSAYQGISYWDCGYFFADDGYILGCPDRAKHARLHEILKIYFDRLFAERKIDFELILYYAFRLIKSQPQIANLLSNIFPWVLIDEYQDTKKIQYSVVAAIVRAGAGRTKAFVVGDPNQAIYGSLGGFAMSVVDFRALCNVHIVELELSDNYRSTDRLIKYFSNFNVQPTGVRGAAPHSAFPSTVAYNSTLQKVGLEDELVKIIKISIAQGFPPSEICVLAPSWILLAAVTRRLVAALPEYQFDGPGMTPFSRDPENFWYRLSRVALTEASPLIYIRRMRWAAAVIKDMDSAGIDVTNLSAKKLLREANSIKLSEVDGLLYLREFFLTLMIRLDINWTSHNLLVDHHQAFFDSSAAKISRLREEGSEFIGGIDFFRKVFRPRTGITVNTIHGVKGGEFDVVIAYGLLQDMVPHFSDPDGVNSAKKLLYVVCSRARKHLYLISENGRNKRFRGQYAPTESLLQCVFNYNKA